MITRRVLVVDDNVGVRELAAAMLEDGGYAVLLAADGPEAMDMLERYSDIALLFTDVVMPGVDGFMLADMAKVRWPLLRVLYATGFVEMLNARSKPGVLHGPIIGKPYGPRDLQAEVERVLC
ncbi:MAG TPA: response regulator [Stellaceae bacterium]|nr:response regulator [Stellaceae bacterium]